MRDIPTLEWRRAVTRDARLLSHIGRATYLATAAADHPGEALLDFLDDSHRVELYRSWLDDPAYLFLIGLTPLGAPAGYAMLAPHLNVSEGDAELKRIYLLPRWQGSGEADRLMTMLLSMASSRQVERVFLSVFETNARARRFYEKHGFDLIGDTDSWLVPGRKLSLYRRTIDT